MTSAHELNLDAAYREIARRSAEGENMSLAYVAADLSIKFHDLAFFVQADLFQAGYSDDGAPYTAEVFFVMAEDARGNRWSHAARFPACVAEHYNDEGGSGTAFHNVKADAEARVERLRARIEAAVYGGAALDLTYWNEERPCYGSAAYQAYGQYDDWCAERLEAGLAI